MGFILAGKLVDDLPVSQAWVFRFSAALSFQRCTFTLTEVDALTGVLGNAISFLGTAVWFTNPKLTIIALVSL
jgi:hypothetical protein